MKKVTFNLDEAMAAAFSKAYPDRGSRSAAFRRAVSALVACGDGSGVVSAPETSIDDEPSGPVKRIPMTIRFTPEQTAGIAGQSKALGMLKGPFVRAVVDAHLDRRPEWPKQSRDKLSAASSQLRSIGVNLNQLTFMCRVARKEGKPFPVAGDELAAVMGGVDALKQAIQEELTSRDSFWDMKVDRNV